MINFLKTFFFVCAVFPLLGEKAVSPKSFVDGFAGPGCVSLGEKAFAQVNCDPETFQFKDDGSMHCTGMPNGGLRSQKAYKNFEMVFEWKHLRYAGNAGIFIWCPRDVLDKLPRGRLPQGIEIQILDLGIEEYHLKNKGKHSNWFTSHGDVFPVGVGRMKAFTPEITYTAKDGTKFKVGKPNTLVHFPSNASRVPMATGTITTYGRSTERYASGSTGRRCRVAMIASRARVTWSWSRRERRSIIVLCA